jgi:hypothetical protein
MGKHKKSFMGGFLALPMALLNCTKFRALSPSATKLLIDVASQYIGNNNGDLSCAWKIMHPKGWNSEATLNKAKKELLAAGFIGETRKGRLPNLCSLYGITWQPLNPNKKLDVGPNGFPVGAWASLPLSSPSKNAPPTTETVARVISIATKTEVGTPPLATVSKAMREKMAVL